MPITSGLTPNQMRHLPWVCGNCTVLALVSSTLWHADDLAAAFVVSSFMEVIAKDGISSTQALDKAIAALRGLSWEESTKIATDL